MAGFNFFSCTLENCSCGDLLHINLHWILQNAWSILYSLEATCLKTEEDWENQQFFGRLSNCSLRKIFFSINTCSTFQGARNWQVSRKDAVKVFHLNSTQANPESQSPQCRQCLMFGSIAWTHTYAHSTFKRGICVNYFSIELIWWASTTHGACAV